MRLAAINGIKLAALAWRALLLAARRRLRCSLTPWLALLLWVGLQSQAFAADPQSLISSEYFCDSDPVLGNGISFTIPASESFTLGAPGTNLFNADITSLGAGLHKLGFRAKDASTNWSNINWLPVQVQDSATLWASVANFEINDTNKLLVAAEFFWDSDPGSGNGISVSAQTGESYTLGAPGSNLFNADISALAAGLHKLGFRARDTSTNWSDVNWLPVQVQDSASLSSGAINSSAINDANKLLVAGEYFWDSDPGQGNGIAASVSVGETFTLGAPGSNLFNADITSLAAGLHKLGFRARDTSTNWSDINWLPIQVPGTPWILLSGQYYSNNVVVTTNGASFQAQIQTRFPNSLALG